MTSWIDIRYFLRQRLNDRIAIWTLDLFKSDAQDLRRLDLSGAFRANKVQACANRFKVDFPSGWHRVVALNDQCPGIFDSGSDDKCTPVWTYSGYSLDHLIARMVKSGVKSKRSSQFAIVLLGLVAIFPIPAFAFAYGDPSGGLLFQVLTPLLAVLWGGWLILAGRVRKGVSKLLSRKVSSASDDLVEAQTETAESD